MAAFGGSWLNHMFLISAQPPVYPDAHKHPQATKLLSKVDGDDPAGTRLALAANSPASALDGPPKFAADGAHARRLRRQYDGPAVPAELRAACGPRQCRVCGPGRPSRDAAAGSRDDRRSPVGEGRRLGLVQRRVAIRARASRHGSVPDFQYHHQPFNYFANYAPGTDARRKHLRDAGVGDDPSTNHFLAAVDAGKLPAVTFYKPQGNLNMHAGYADVESGDRHIANVIEHIRRSPQWANTVIVMTHDENGGWWDHVAPPVGDRWGPGSRIPALVISPFAKKGHVDHTMYDTNSILRFIGRVHGLAPLDGVAARDRAFASRGAPPPGDLTNALDFG
jgi:phospholipase C